jgi:hypothetical protein
MTAIVTSKFRVVNATNFKQDITDIDNSVYVFIGKSDAWSDSITDLSDGTAPTPVDTNRDIAETYKDLIAAKIITSADVTHVVPRYNWTSGNAYVGWNDQDDEIFTKQFYVLTDERKVFKCLKAGTGSSIVKPTLAQVPPDSTGGDGYVWKYMYTLAILDAEKFLTNFYIPVKTVVLPASGLSSDLTVPSDLVQYNNQQSSISTLQGKIYDIRVSNGGIGYTSATAVITGDGTGATATVQISSGIITGLIVTNAGQNYNIATVTISGDGTDATAYPIMSPPYGHGSDPVNELGGYYVGVNARLEYDDGLGDFIVENNFRQIGLIKNPLDATGNSVSSATTFSGLSEIQLASGAGFKTSDYITGTTSFAVAYVDEFDPVELKIKFHQNNKTAYGIFTDGEQITGSLGGSGNLVSSAAISSPEYTRFSGQIIFLENRDPINRTASQIEDVKVIIEF